MSKVEGKTTSASAEVALRCLYPEDNGQVMDFSANPALSIAYVELKTVRKNIAQQEQREAQLKQTLQQAMGEATRAEFSSGYISWKKSKDNVGLDV